MGPGIVADLHGIARLVKDRDGGGGHQVGNFLGADAHAGDADGQPFRRCRGSDLNHMAVVQGNTVNLDGVAVGILDIEGLAPVEEQLNAAQLPVGNVGDGSRLTGQGIPVSCEVDIYGCLSEFIGTVVSEDAVTLLDINNSVPADMYEEEIEGKYPYTLKDTFMGFHCGNTTSGKLAFCEMRNQKIMARSLPVEVTNGTLEGDIMPGDITFFRLQSTADCELRAYIAHGEVLPVD